MNKYVRQLFGVMFQSKQTRQIVRIKQQQLAPKSPAQWCEYWQAHGQPWRTEPEIDLQRQQELSTCLAIDDDIEKDLYPFQGVKLSRADVEWLLATHENGLGPVDWDDERQRGRWGLDLRGADLRGVDLRDLPLARLRGGFTEKEWNRFKDEPKKRTRILLEKADLRRAHLEGAVLRRAHLEDASLGDAYLQCADLESALLEHARLYRVHLEGASLGWAHLEYAHLRGAILKRTNLKSAYLEGAHLTNLVLCDEQRVGPQVVDARWEQANLSVVEWSRLEQLGEEHKARQKYDGQGGVKSKEQRLIEYETAVRANRQLAVALLNQGLNEDGVCQVFCVNSLQSFHAFSTIIVGKGKRPVSPSH